MASTTTEQTKEVGPLVEVPTTLDRKKYIILLEDNLIPYTENNSRLAVFFNKTMQAAMPRLRQKSSFFDVGIDLLDLPA
eukprot:IDg10760t1